MRPLTSTRPWHLTIVTVAILLASSHRAYGSSPCPAPTPQGLYVSSAGAPNGVLAPVSGHVAKLESGESVITDLKKKVEIRGLLFEGYTQGRYVVPTGGEVKSISIDGKNLQLKTRTIKSGCVTAQDLGPVLLLLRLNFSPDYVTLVLTPEQLKKLP